MDLRMSTVGSVLVFVLATGIVQSKSTGLSDLFREIARNLDDNKISKRGCDGNKCANGAACNDHETPLLDDYGIDYYCQCEGDYGGLYCEIADPCSTCPGGTDTCWPTNVDDSGRYCFDASGNSVGRSLNLAQAIERSLTLAAKHHPDVQGRHHPDVQGRNHPDVQGRNHPDVQGRNHPDVQGRNHPDVQGRNHPDVQERHHPDIQGKHHPDIQERNHPGLEERNHPGLQEKNHPGLEERNHPDLESRNHPDRRNPFIYK